MNLRNNNNDEQDDFVEKERKEYREYNQTISGLFTFAFVETGKTYNAKNVLKTLKDMTDFMGCGEVLCILSVVNKKDGLELTGRLDLLRKDDFILMSPPEDENEINQDETPHEIEYEDIELLQVIEFINLSD